MLNLNRMKVDCLNYEFIYYRKQMLILFFGFYRTWIDKNHLNKKNENKLKTKK